MKIDRQKLLTAMAAACMNPYDLCEKAGIPYQTYRRIANENNCKPATIGKIANALNISVDDIIKKDLIEK